MSPSAVPPADGDIDFTVPPERNLRAPHPFS